MNKKILVMGVVGMFLLTSFTAVSAIEKERKTAVLPVNAQLFQKESETTPLYPSTGGGDTWKKTYGNPEWETSANWIQQTTDGGYIATGHEIRINDPFNGVWLFKIDENGNMDWEKTFNISNGYDSGNFVQQTSDGGYIIIGCTDSYGDDSKILLIKTDENGEKEWNRTFGEEYETWSGSGQQTGDDGYIIAGNIRYSDDYSDAWLIKTDSNGNKEWDRIFNKSDEDYFGCIDITQDGGYIITGNTGQWPQKSLWLLETDADGNTMWEKNFEYQNHEHTSGCHVQQTSDSGYIVLGNAFKNLDDVTHTIWLIKTDENGEIIWDKTYGGRLLDIGTSVQQTSDSGYILTGIKHVGLSFNIDIWLLKTNANGEKMWERTYGRLLPNFEGGNFVQQTSDGGYIIAGAKAKGTGGLIQIHDWVIKTNENGKVAKSSVNINSQQSNNLKRQRNSQTTGIGGSILEAISEKRITNIIYDIASMVESDGKLIITESSNGHPWPMFGQNPQHTGLSPCDTSSNPGELKWRYEAEGNIRSSPAIAADGTIYVGSTDHYLYAINPDGTLKWRYETGDEIWESSPAIAEDDTIYIGSDNLYAINPDGTLKWEFPTGDASLSSPTIGDDGTIYIGPMNNYFYAINPNGTLKWKFETEGEIWYSSPAIAEDGTIYLDSFDSYLYAINPDGTLKWKFEAVGDVYTPAVGDDGTIYFGAEKYLEESFLYAVNPDGTEKWKVEMDYMLTSPAIGPDGTIYCFAKLLEEDISGDLVAVNPDGSLKWKFSDEDCWNPRASPAIGSDGTIYVGSDRSIFYAVNPDGSLKWKYDPDSWIAFLPHSSPAIGDDGTVYIGSDDHHLYAIETKLSNEPPEKPTLNGPTSGKPGETYTYTASAFDPEGDDICYYFLWEGHPAWEGGFARVPETGYVLSGTEVEASVSWEKIGVKKVWVKAKDVHGYESEPATLTVIMPKNHQANNLQSRQRNSQTTGIGGSILEAISEKRITNIIYDIASVVESNELRNNNMGIQSEQVCVQPGILLTNDHLSVLQKNLQYIKDPVIKQILQDIITVIESEGKIDSEGVQEILSNYDTDITGVYSLASIDTIGGCDGKIIAIPGTIRAYAQGIPLFCKGNYIYYKYHDYGEHGECGWNFNISGEPIPEGKGHIIGFFGYAECYCGVGFPPLEYYFYLGGVGPFEYGFGVLVFHQAYENNQGNQQSTPSNQILQSIVKTTSR